MSKIKVLLNVVEGMRSLADSMAELADVIAATGEIASNGYSTAQTAPVAPHGARSTPNESQQGGQLLSPPRRLHSPKASNPPRPPLSSPLLLPPRPPRQWMTSPSSIW